MQEYPSAYHDPGMPVFTNGDVRIHYEESGSGYPVLLFAAGLMRSSIPMWERLTPTPAATLSDGFRVIAFDQRNAGSSRAPIRSSDSWTDYALDAIALIDHLGLDSVHVWGRCIGPSFIMKLLEVLGPDSRRITAFVDHDPIGLSGVNRGHFMHGFYGWTEELPAEVKPTQAGADVIIASFCENMFGGDFVFSVPRDFVRTLETPMLVLPGHNLAHPEPIAIETARLARNCELRLGWHTDPDGTAVAIRDFLTAHRRH
jgi:pimeloyl-ACP methyl ester carboxylesterase